MSNLISIDADLLSNVCGGLVCQRESMGYVNPPGTCSDFISTAPGFGQAGGPGGAPLTESQRAAVDRARASAGVPALPR